MPQGMLGTQKGENIVNGCVTALVEMNTVSPVG
jgi:hypothetical protein